MHIHPPKPLHGWRAFLGEVGVIVIGVLIALSAEQLVDKLHWHHEVHLASEALARELTVRHAAAEERLRYFSCIDRRLNELAGVVDAAARSGRLRPLGLIGRPPSRDWDGQTWLSVQNSEVANHLSQEQRTAYATIYSGISDFRRMQEPEWGIWTELQQLSGPGRRFDAEDARTLRLSIGRARLTNRVLGLDSAQLLRDLRNSRMALPPFGSDMVGDAAADFQQPMRERTLCQPIGRTVPATYGQAPLSETVPQMILQPGDKGPPPAPPYPTL